MRIIGSNFTGGNQLFWYVRADSPIKSLKDAAGKTVAYSTNGSSTHTSVLALKKFTGVDFMPTQTGAAPATYTQVMSGQIDVGWAGAPFGVDAVEQGRTRVIAKASDDPVLDRQTIRLMIANSNEMAKRPDVFVRFMRAYREALDWVYSTPEGLRPMRNGRASRRRPPSARSRNSCPRRRSIPTGFPVSMTSWRTP